MAHLRDWDAHNRAQTARHPWQVLRARLSEAGSRRESQADRVLPSEMLSDSGIPQPDINRLLLLHVFLFGNTKGVGHLDRAYFIAP